MPCIASVFGFTSCSMIGDEISCHTLRALHAYRHLYFEAVRGGVCGVRRQGVALNRIERMRENKQTKQTKRTNKNDVLFCVGCGLNPVKKTIVPFVSPEQK